MFRKPLFWILLAALSIASVLFSSRYFSRAFPIVSIDLRMSRESALARSAELSSRFQFPPAGYSQVASFGGDQEVQNFVELEGGGTQAFRTMMVDGLYHPFKWSVRHFKPGETHETNFFFTPRGENYGFSVKLPEKEPGAALEPDAALKIAEEGATRDWQLDLRAYRLVEKSQDVRTGGRIDHSFVYERQDVRAGEGRYRVRLNVGGDKLTGVVHFVKVPEAFKRRYEKMRSANEVISAAGSITLVLAYLVGGCGVGIFFLLRQRWVIWGKPLAWGIFISFLQFLAGLNQWPLLWVGYDTAISAQGFVIQQLVLMILSFLGFAGLFTLSFAVAESLSRKAFPDHPQMWSLWSKGISNSREVLGTTVAGYFLVAVFFGYEVILYFTANRTLGWWTPSDSLIQPDILATYLPWLSPIAISAQAGFWEECLFRAVPLAGAAILGTRFGRRNWWIAGAMVLQAVIFGTGHAGYANQPSYARVVELIVPSLMFGGLYLSFGLLPGIVLHYTFDVVWFALPLFVSSAPGIMWHRAMVILLVLVPLWVVFAGRIRSKSWDSVPETFLNRSWQPAPPQIHGPTVEKAPTGAISPAMLKILPAAGILGLAAWLMVTEFKSDAPPLNMSRAEAASVAKKTLNDRGVKVPDSWKVLTSVVTTPGESSRFVWQTSGKDTYKALIHEYLNPPCWFVRFANFEGDVAENAEEYQVWISDAKGAFRVKHQLPEGKAGNSIAEAEARKLSQEEISREFKLDPGLLKEVSASPAKLKARTDWVFTFSDPRAPQLKQGEKRIGVSIGGDQVLDIYRFIHVPEEWSRQQRDKETIPNIVRAVCAVLTGIMVVTGMVIAIFSWSRKGFVASSFVVIFLLLLFLNLSSALNSIPAVTSLFSTAQPYKVQMFIFLGVGILGAAIMSAGAALVAGLVHYWQRDAAKGTALSIWTSGLSLGAAAAGLSSAGAWLRPSLSPTWGDFSSIGTLWPLGDMVLDSMSGYFQFALYGILLFAFAHRLTREWSGKRLLYGVLLFIFGFAVIGARGVDSMGSWIASGAAMGVALLAGYVLVLRFSLPAFFPAAALLQSLSWIRHAAQSQLPLGVPGLLLGMAGMWFSAAYLVNRMARTDPSANSPG